MKRAPHICFLAVLVVTCALTSNSAVGLFLDGGPVDGRTWNNVQIPVCFRPIGTEQPDGNGGVLYTVNYGSAEWLATRSLVQETVERTWEHWTQLDFFGWGVCPAFPWGYLYVDLIKDNTGGSGDSVPKGFFEGGTRVWMKFGDANNTSEARKRNVIMHEFGHALGFHHEMDRPEGFYGNPPMPYCTDGAVYYAGGTYLTDYDDVSIMSYCSVRRASLSYGDIVGAQNQYGSSPEGQWLNAMPALSFLSM